MIHLFDYVIAFIFSISSTFTTDTHIRKHHRIIFLHTIRLPERVIATLMAEFQGFEAIGNSTKNMQLIKKTTGMIVLTLIGRGMFGCLRLSTSMPNILAATENHNIWL